MQSHHLVRAAAAAAVAASVCGGAAAAHAGTVVDQTRAPRPVAAPGQRGDVVRALQVHLSDLGYLHTSVTGYYGPRTRDAVATFQRAHRLKATGVDDAMTDSVLNAAYDADPHHGWVRSVTRTRTGWTVTVVKDRPCIAGDTSVTCRGHIPRPGQTEVVDVAMGTKTMAATAGTRVAVIKKGSSAPGPWMSLPTALARKALPGKQLLVRWDWDAKGHLATVQQEWRP